MQVNPIGCYLLIYWRLDEGPPFLPILAPQQKQMSMTHRLQPFPSPHSWQHSKRRFLFQGLTSKNLPNLKIATVMLLCRLAPAKDNASMEQFDQNLANQNETEILL